jgi:GTP-binding protein EngB required for normal cell division
MDTLDARNLIAQLADDLGWLEEHTRRQPNNAADAGRVRLAAALIRNLIGPFILQPNAEPLHLAVVGGAGAGKSTIVNFLVGATLAEANPQAGFTRHPIAYVHGQANLHWPAQPGFLGPLQRLTDPTPANRDEDVYQVRRAATTHTANGQSVAVAEPLTLLDRFVIWDCPDMTTWAAAGYVPRLLEVAGLADILVYVASDERYNDEVPTQFLRLLVQAGKPVIVVLTKMNAQHTNAFIEHFRTEVLQQFAPEARGLTAILAVPHLPHEELSNPGQKAAQYRVPLLNQVLVLAEPPLTARRRAAQAAVQFLRADCDRLINVARTDLDALANWREAVQHGQEEFIDRYRREFLAGQRLHRFDEALVRLLDLLDLPGPGKLVSTVLWVVRAPYRLVRGLIGKALARPESVQLPERDVLEQAFRAWLDALRTEALRRTETHPIWRHVADAFGSGLDEQVRVIYERGVRDFQSKLSVLVEDTAAGILADLEKNPAWLNTLRAGKVGLDVTAVVTAIALTGGIGTIDLLIVPLAASLTHQMVEWLGQGYVDNLRARVRAKQEALAMQYLSGPIAEWLARWPASGGTAYERLQRAVQRLPENIQQLAEGVAQASA